MRTLMTSSKLQRIILKVRFTSRFKFQFGHLNLKSKEIEMIPFELPYSGVRNKHTPTLINFLSFFQGLQTYSGLHRAYISSISIRYKGGYAYSFCQIFQGAMFIQGATFIPDSRVV